ncbi:uncharacterized protein LOC143293811 isoform X2 [Babylonia areolata]|uniref:uncharacterized protein LOC143293811 isoform X2 n=1 Tax=Babylonia areolata TaxID=304850 RepID=UPI003FD4ABF3
MYLNFAAVQDDSGQLTTISTEPAAVVNSEPTSSSTKNIATDPQSLTGEQMNSTMTQPVLRQNELTEEMEVSEAGSSKEMNEEVLPESILYIKNEVSIQANDYEIERATGILPARKRFIPLKYRDFRSTDDIDRDDDRDSDYEPEPLNQFKEPKTKRGRGRPRKYPEGKSDNGKQSEEKKPLMARTVNGYKCLTCNHVFSQKGNFKVHLLTHTNERPWQCDIDNCEKGFRTKESLRRHKLSHMGIKPFECTECKKKFCSAFSLQEHMSLHNDERPYTCSHCQRNFRQISCLRRHLLTHSTEMPHSCDVCNRRFSQAVYLRSHMKVHTGEKPFCCDQCNKCFAHASDLTRHKIIHSGSKPYSCSVCSMRFSDPSSRRRHEKEHEGMKAYTCHLCSEGFKRASQLRAHLYRRHGGLKEGVEFQIQEGTQPVSYRIELHDPQADSSDAASGKMIDLSTFDQKKIISIIQNLNRNMVVQEVEVCGETVDSSGSSHVSVVASDSAQPADMEHMVLPVEVVSAVEKGSEVSSAAMDVGETETGHIVQDLGSTFQILQGVGGKGEVDGQPVYEVHYHPPPPSQPSSSAVTTMPSQPTTAASTSDSSPTPEGTETSCAVDDTSPPSSSARNTSSVVLPSTAVCLNSDFVSKPDFGSQDYYDWLSSFTEVCKVLSVPLEVELFQKISQVHKSLSDFMASPSGVIADKENFKILMSISVELGHIQNEHLKCMFHNL